MTPRKAAEKTFFWALFDAVALIVLGVGNAAIAAGAASVIGWSLPLRVWLVVGLLVGVTAIPRALAFAQLYQVSRERS